jgi:hypothetical protein
VVADRVGDVSKLPGRLIPAGAWRADKAAPAIKLVRVVDRPTEAPNQLVRVVLRF